ncbi:hypothetical protein AB6A40_011142, partial [Gnathostoma spinigerum]
SAHLLDVANDFIELRQFIETAIQGSHSYSTESLQLRGGWHESESE